MKSFGTIIMSDHHFAAETLGNFDHFSPSKSSGTNLKFKKALKLTRRAFVLVTLIYVVVQVNLNKVELRRQDLEQGGHHHRLKQLDYTISNSDLGN